MSAETITVADAFNQAIAHHQGGRLAEAEQLYRAILRAEPNHGDAHHNLGVVASQTGRLEAGLPHFKFAVESNPSQTQYWLSYIDALLRAGQAAEAQRMLGEARRRGIAGSQIDDLSTRANADRRPEELFAVGNAQYHAGQFEQAVATFRAALALKPDYAYGHVALGAALFGLELYDEAEGSYRQALALDPGFAQAHSNLGAALNSLGRKEEAVASYRRAVELMPEFAIGHSNLGDTLHDLGRLAEAEASCRRALELEPGLAMAHNNLGGILRDRGRLEEAEASFRRAIELDPGFAMAHGNLGTLIGNLGRQEQALEHLERAIALKPDLVLAHRTLLSALSCHPSIEPDAAFAAHRRFEAMLAQPHYAKIAPHGNTPDPERRLRIGYLSSDFRTHSVARNLLPQLKSRDPARFEIYCYAEVAQPDATTAAFQALADGWRSTVGMSDEQVAAQIRADKVDILVCLAGRLDRNRPLVCAFKPAPIQISYYDTATSGLGTMDYLLSDRVMAPRDTRERFTERVLRLPNFYVAGPPDDLPTVAPRSGPVAFGSLNHPSKVNDAVLDLWGRVLASVPDSRLVLRYRNLFDAPTLRGRVEAALDRHGVDRGRVSYPPEATSSRDHLSLYNEIDIALDTFPFAGSTTTFEALLMGVPVVTAPGWSMMSRWTASMLTSVGLQEFVASSARDYVRIARELAAAAPRRADLRAGLRARVLASPLTDHARRMRQIERFYRVVWRRWCRRQNPAPPAAPGDFSLRSDTEYLSRLARLVAGGDVGIECDARRLRSMDSPVAVQAETERWAVGMVIVVGSAWWLTGFWSAVAALAVSGAAYATLGRYGVRRAIERRVREKALKEIGTWHQLWNHGGVRLVRAHDGKTEICNAPGDSWIRFVETALRKGDVA